MNKIRILILTLSLAVVAYGQTETLQELIQTAIEVSPKVKMLEAKRDAAYSRIDINSNIPDPVLTLGLANMPTNSFSFTQEPMTQKVVGLSQSFPFPGSLSAVEEANSVDTLIISEEIKETVNETKMMVEQKYYELGFLRRAISLSKESLGLLNSISEVVASKYTVSTASQQNVIKVQLQITNLLEKIDELESKEQSTLVSLNALLLRDETSLIFTTDIEEMYFQQFSKTELDSMAIINRPLLRSINYAEAKSELNQNAADKKFSPNFNFQVQYGFRDRIEATGTELSDFLSVMLGVTLPLNYGGKYSSAVEEHVSMKEYYSKQHSFVMQNLTGRFGEIVTQLKSIEERIELYDTGLLPQAQQNYNSALSSYQVNELDFINVIDAQDQLLKLETNFYRLKTDYIKLVSELEFLTGTEFYQEN